MARRRTEVTMRPSRAQGSFLAAFEKLYFARGKTQDGLKKDVESAREANPYLATSAFSRSTYYSWRRQETSPSVHDLELLCKVSGERQTLVVDPSPRSTDEEETGTDMEWLEEADNLIAQMNGLSPHQRSAVLGELRGLIRAEFAKAAQRNPQESDVAPRGPSAVRRK
jgi:hypothetical protein